MFSLLLAYFTSERYDSIWPYITSRSIVSPPVATQGKGKRRLTYDSVVLMTREEEIIKR
jgi:hypothetical protein